ncbi:hypothetical protein ATEIFO6365_0004067300 [Aspergillus terreus]|uniref:Uncharacterized protein n=1 Tax=Aspergillus terreus TaxID=33178 RepID=A0A5M3YTY4_ASPTE|nr:hypothetical protein ATETN484_0002069800 [Aspergillus terreus]GFF15554.1 hypothetical protein ATEIFO6365_0004067300 [Aspergillus terreus]
MSTPERRSDRATLSRRNHQQPQQQLHQPSSHHSPFRRGYPDSRTAGRFDASKIPSPSQNYSARRRRTFSQTGTLRGAFEAVSRYPTMAESDHLAYNLGSPGRGGERRRQSFNPASPESNPPNELMEAYRQIDDAGSLVDQDELDDDLRATLGLNESRGRSSWSGSAFRDDAGLFYPSDAELLNDVTDDSLRRRPVDRVRDELRLKRATSSRSPVLNRTGSTPALTSENLQRREEAEREALQNAVEVEEYDDDQKPSLNLPRNWGTRGTHRRDWLKSMARRNEPEPDTFIDESKPSPPKPKSGLEVQKNSPERLTSRTPNTLGERLASTYNRFPLSDARNRSFSESKEEKTGDVGLNTPPVMVYKSSTFNKRSPTKRDSHDLLRKLSRTESPSQNPSELRTPEPQKIPGTRIYDKTPVVTGAWIDTPMTERPTARPSYSSNPIAASPATRSVQDISRARSEERVAEPQPSEPEIQRPNEMEKKQPQQEQVREVEKALPSSTEGQAHGSRTEIEQQPEPKKTETHSEKTRKPRDKPPLAKPDHPKSALETVMEDFKADKNSLDVGDDTLESLQEILNEQVTEVKTEEEDNAAYEKRILEKLERGKSSKKENLEGRNSSHQDSDDFDSMNQTLKSFAKSMKEVKAGIEDLGDQVKSMPSPDANSSKFDKTCDNCETCRAHNGGGIYTIVPIPKLWTRNRVSGRIRPTRLGWCAIVLFIWFWSESTMCDFYCHPLIADVCEGNCLLPDAPRFPFVIPTMLWRWSHLQGVLAPVWAISMAFFRLIAQLLGFWDGYVDESPRALNLSGEIWVHGNRLSGVPGVAPTPQGSSYRAASTWQEQEVKYPKAVPALDLEKQNEDSMDDDEFI